MTEKIALSIAEFFFREDFFVIFISPLKKLHLASNSHFAIVCDDLKITSIQQMTKTSSSLLQRNRTTRKDSIKC